MEDFDLTGLDPQAAKQYIVAVISSLKSTTAKRAELEKERDIWTSRIELAKQNDKSDLQAAAEIRAQDIENELYRIQAVEKALSDGVARMKRQLRMMQNQPQLSIDPDALLAGLELLGGETDELADKFKDEEAKQALDELKKKIEGEETDS